MRFSRFLFSCILFSVTANCSEDQNEYWNMVKNKDLKILKNLKNILSKDNPNTSKIFNETLSYFSDEVKQKSINYSNTMKTSQVFKERAASQEDLDSLVSFIQNYIAFATDCNLPSIDTCVEDPMLKLLFYVSTNGASGFSSTAPDVRFIVDYINNNKNNKDVLINNFKSLKIIYPVISVIYQLLQNGEDTNFIIDIANSMENISDAISEAASLAEPFSDSMAMLWRHEYSKIQEATDVPDLYKRQKSMLCTGTFVDMSAILPSEVSEHFKNRVILTCKHLGPNEAFSSNDILKKTDNGIFSTVSNNVFFDIKMGTPKNSIGRFDESLANVKYFIADANNKEHYADVALVVLENPYISAKPIAIEHGNNFIPGEEYLSFGFGYTPGRIFSPDETYDTTISNKYGFSFMDLANKEEFRLFDEVLKGFSGWQTLKGKRALAISNNDIDSFYASINAGPSDSGSPILSKDGSKCLGIVIQNVGDDEYVFEENKSTLSNMGGVSLKSYLDHFKKCLVEAYNMENGIA